MIIVFIFGLLVMCLFKVVIKFFNLYVVVVGIIFCFSVWFGACSDSVKRVFGAFCCSVCIFGIIFIVFIVIFVGDNLNFLLFVIVLIVLIMFL